MALKSVLGGLNLFCWVSLGSCGVMRMLGALRVWLSPAGTGSVSGNIHLGTLPAVAVAMWPLSHSARGVTAAGRCLQHSGEKNQIPWEWGKGSTDPLGVGKRENRSPGSGERGNRSPRSQKGKPDPLGAKQGSPAPAVPAVLSLLDASAHTHSWDGIPSFAALGSAPGAGGCSVRSLQGQLSVLLGAAAAQGLEGRCWV